MSLDGDHDEPEKLKISGVEQQSVYVYKSAKRSAQQNRKSSKRRKVHGAVQGENGTVPFVPLLAGHENKSAVELRHREFQTFWSNREDAIQTILCDVHSEVSTDIASFIAQAVAYHDRIPTGVITLGSNISSIGSLLSRLQEEVGANGQDQVIILDSGDASNLKALLKTMIRVAITHSENDEVYRNLMSDRMGPKLLPYDLELLHEYVQRRRIGKMVVAFKDSEAIDQRLLSDFVSLLGSWLDRIPFILLFGVVTSVDLFEGRLPRSTAKRLQGRHFEVQDSDNSIDRIYAVLQSHEDSGPWLGHGVSKLITQHARDHFQSPERFKASVKYAIMTHFFANPLSVFLSNDPPVEFLEQPRLCEAIRNLPSFRRHVDNLLAAKDTTTVRKLLQDNAYLTTYARSYVDSGRRQMKSMFDAVECIMAVVKMLDGFKSITYSNIAVMALRGDLLDSKIVQDMRGMVKKLPSDRFRQLLMALSERFAEVEEMLHGLDLLLKDNNKGSEPLRSQYDDRQTTHTTTVVGQRLKLTKGKTKLSNEESEYTVLVDRLEEVLGEYLSDRLIAPEILFMHEAFLSDHRTPTMEAFTPRTRFAIERGLLVPADYLESQSDDDEDSAANLSPSQPAISILYQLYAESGAFVNIYDLWQAFYTIIGGVDGESCEERVALTMFYRALSELKMLGIVKSTRKKPDHLAKSTWAGL